MNGIRELLTDICLVGAAWKRMREHERENKRVCSHGRNPFVRPIPSRNRF